MERLLSEVTSLLDNVLQSKIDGVELCSLASREGFRRLIEDFFNLDFLDLNSRQSFRPKLQIQKKKTNCRELASIRKNGSGRIRSLLSILLCRTHNLLQHQATST